MIRIKGSWAQARRWHMLQSRFSSSFFVALFSAFVTNGALAYATENFVFNAASESISVDGLQQYVNVLADDSFEGRAMGSRGATAAAGWIVRKLQQDGLKPAGVDGGYF